MKVEKRRCSHCGVEYTFYLSGGIRVKNNDGVYCSDCKGVMIAALMSVPRKFYIADEDVPELSYDDIMAIEIKLKAEAKQHHRLAVFKTSGHVFDSSMGSNGSFGYSINYGEYWLTRWPNSDQYMIHRQIYVDANTGLKDDGTQPIQPAKRYGAPDNSYTRALVNQPGPMAKPLGVVYGSKLIFKGSTDE